MMKKIKTKRLQYWAGFVDDKLAETLELYGDRLKMPAIYIRKSDAKVMYEDVRKVEVKIIKP